jgi:hypothetical protein
VAICQGCQQNCIIKTASDREGREGERERECVRKRDREWWERERKREGERERGKER